jgi:hypothetical protein
MIGTCPGVSTQKRSAAMNMRPCTQVILLTAVLMSETVDFRGGSVIKVDDDLGLAFGFGYNFSDQFTLSGEIG